MLKHMQALVDLARFVSWGASSGWFGLGCPAHCSGSLVVLCAVFLAGLSSGALAVLLFGLYLGLGFGPFQPSPPASRSVPRARLLAYLHERGSVRPDLAYPD